MDELERLALAVQLPAFEGTTWDADAWRLLEEGLGGVCLFGSNTTGGPDQIAELCGQVRARAEHAVIAIDEEGGDVTRLHYHHGSPVPGNAVLGHLDDPDLTRRAAASIASELAAVGVNLNFAPVADVNTASANPVIGIRSFSSDAGVAARHVRAYIEGLQAFGVGSCAKHFPGHGSTITDSHLTVPLVEASLEVLRGRDLVPFVAAVEAGVDAVMTSHILVPALDPDHVSTLSSRVLGMLRTELGFTGTIVTDALDMAGASRGRGVPAAAVLALAAGADLLCLGADKDPALVRATQRAIVDAVRAGALSVERLTDAAASVAGLAVPLVGAPVVPLTSRQAIDAARAALTIEGELPELVDPLWCRVDTPASIAVGGVPWGVATRHVIDAGDPALGLSELLLHTRGRTVIVQVRDAQRVPGFEGIMRAMQAVSPLVIVEYGWPAPAGPGLPARVLTYGGSAASAAAVADWVADGGRP